jgi:hypothetical protein
VRTDLASPPLPPYRVQQWLKTKLTEQGFSYRTISGSMPLNQRAKAIEAFQKGAPSCRSLSFVNGHAS